jgi:hypothetical protein
MNEKEIYDYLSNNEIFRYEAELQEIINIMSSEFGFYMSNLDEDTLNSVRVFSTLEDYVESYFETHEISQDESIYKYITLSPNRIEGFGEYLISTKPLTIQCKNSSNRIFEFDIQ